MIALTGPYPHGFAIVGNPWAPQFLTNPIWTATQAKISITSYKKLQSIWTYPSCNGIYSCFSQLETSIYNIYRGFPSAMFDYRRVCHMFFIFFFLSHIWVVGQSHSPTMSSEPSEPRYQGASQGRVISMQVPAIGISGCSSQIYSFINRLFIDLIYSTNTYYHIVIDI
jgi:hypothetical protein